MKKETRRTYLNKLIKIQKQIHFIGAGFCYLEKRVYVKVIPNQGEYLGIGETEDLIIKKMIHIDEDVLYLTLEPTKTDYKEGYDEAIQFYESAGFYKRG